MKVPVSVNQAAPKKRQLYIELGADYFDRRKKQTAFKNAVKRLEASGYKVTLEAVVA